MDDEYYLDDEITDLVAEMVKQDAAKAMALLCGLLIGVVESAAENQGHDPRAKMELVGAPRTVTISAATT
jgi:hypothetical protein